jgi:hypothetical protein
LIWISGDCFQFQVIKCWYELLRLRQISIIFQGFRFLENFDLGNFDLFLWYYWRLMCWVFILYNDFILVVL